MTPPANCSAYGQAMIEAHEGGRVTLTVGGRVLCAITTDPGQATVDAALALCRGIGGAFRVVRRGF